MKLLKKYCLVLLAATALFLALALASCAPDKGSERIHYSDLGVIESLGGGYYFQMMRDDGVLLSAVENRSEDFELYPGKRVYCSYEILETTYDQDGSKQCAIIALGFDNILSKPAVRRSFIEEDYQTRADSIGNDLIGIIYDSAQQRYRAWLGGDHLNIEFIYQRARGNTNKHMINLVWDDIDSDNCTVNLYLRHNAYGFTGEGGYLMEYAAGFVSFPILETIPKNCEEVTIRLYYNWDGSSADPSEEYLEQTFRPGTTTSFPDTIKNTGENLMVAPPDGTVYLE